MCDKKVIVGVSNHHVHLSVSDLETLFGKGHGLTNEKDLIQPGEFASKERVDIIGPKGCIKGLRVLGTFKDKTQVEISMTDARKIGIKAPLRESEHVENTPGCRIAGPCAEIEIDSGVIIQQRHLHLNPAQASELHLKDGDIVSARISGTGRETVYGDIIVRCGQDHEKELHLDTDEGNAAACSTGDYAEILV